MSPSWWMPSMNCPRRTIAEGRAGQPQHASLDDCAFVALGSNLASPAGRPHETVRQALAQLAPLSRSPVRWSSLWHSEPVDCPPDAAAFVNAVAALRPPEAMDAHELLRSLLALESRFGRRRDGTINAPRMLDLDLICWGSRCVRDDELVLPHPRACQRAFVLLPLAELAPRLVMPGQTTSVAELAGRLPAEGVNRLATRASEQ